LRTIRVSEPTRSENPEMGLASARVGGWCPSGAWRCQPAWRDSLRCDNAGTAGADQTRWTSSSDSTPSKSSGLRVKSGRPAPSAVAAMSRSTARRPRALRPDPSTAA